MNDTYKAIELNENLSEQVKNDIKELVEIFHQTFKNVNLENFNERIKSLRIKRGSSYLIKSDSEYSPRENALYLVEDKLIKTDAKHSMMMRVLEMINAKDNFYGFNDNGKLEGLNAGITEILANNLVGNDAFEKHFDEMVLMNLISASVGFENVLNAYFNNNSEYLTKPFVKNSKSPEKAVQLLDEIQYNYVMKERLGSSNLSKLQIELIECSMNDDTKDYFMYNTVTDPDMLPKDVKYDNIELNDIKPYFVNTLEEQKVA